MHLLKALNNFPTRRFKRLELRNGAALKDACLKFDGPERISEQPEDRIRRVLFSFKADDAALLDRRDIRFITAAIGSSGLIAPSEISQILAEIERRQDRRLLRGTFRALLATYDEQRARSLVRAFVARHVRALPANICSFSERSGILAGDGHLQTLGEELCRARDIQTYCLSIGINTNILASKYGTELKLAALGVGVKSSDAKLLQRLLDWVFGGINSTPIGEYYHAMLSPFDSEVPSPEVQKLLMGTLVSKYGDPRIGEWPGLRGNDGKFRSDKCVATIKRWLSIEYLDLFVRIIETTAEDRQFRPRKRFWLQYFEKGVISDLTLILASDASAIARRMRRQTENAEYMKWATLKRALPNQSVLLMRLGDLVIAEWSHSGAMQFWKVDNTTAPEFHLPEYFSSALRNGSVRIKVGNEFRDALIHYENGHWMTWARNAIEYHTGVSV